MIYPFLPAIARGLGVSLFDVDLIVSARSLLGVISPPLGSISDRLGRKIAMLVGMGLFTASLAVVSVWPVYPVFFLSMLLVAAGKYVFDAAVQAYVGERVEYSRRGFAIAITELGWSLAFLIGMPVLGLAIQNYGLRSPFPFMAALGLVMGYVLWRVLPADSQHASNRPSFVASVRIILAHPSALAGLAVGVLIVLANELIFIVYGDWMERSFHLNVSALGVASMVIGFAELGGESLVAGLADRLGKKRAVGVGIVLNALVCLALGSLGQNLIAALIGLFLFSITFEFTIVSAIPLMTELVPGARATLMAGNIAAAMLGRALGDLIGPLIFTGSLLANGVAAAALNVAAVVVLYLFVRMA